MSISGGTPATFEELICPSLDTNNNGAVTDSLDIAILPLGIVTTSVISLTGTHATHVITLQTSPDDTVWFDRNTIAGSDTCNDCDINAMRYIRAKVTTVEGAASTCKVIIQAK